ncbi:MAG TPA: SsrA-binding protein, partial [Bacteroidales bacterium]|nr:SsrA-binding protein [Bacteroidales bacterium]
MAKKKENTHLISIKNRKAEFEYFLMTKYTAGIVLT